LKALGSFYTCSYLSSPDYGEIASFTSKSWFRYGRPFIFGLKRKDFWRESKKKLKVNQTISDILKWSGFNNSRLLKILAYSALSIMDEVKVLRYNITEHFGSFFSSPFPKLKLKNI